MREHELVRKLEEALATRAELTLVVTASARAAKSLAAATLKNGVAHLGVAFTTWNGLARSLLRRLGKVAPGEVLGVVERERLRRALAARGSGPLMDVVELPASFPALQLAWREVWRGEVSDGRLEELSEAARELLALPPPVDARRALLAALRADGARLDEVRVLIAGTLPDGGLQACLTDALERCGASIEKLPYSTLAPPHRELWCTPDPASEMRLAAALCSQARSRGIPFGRMLVVAPSLGPYVEGLATAFARERVPFLAQAETPLAQEPRCALLLQAARVLFGTAPRSAFVALLGSPLVAKPLSHELLGDLERAARERDASGRGPTTAAFASHLPNPVVGAGKLAGAERVEILRAYHGELVQAPAPGSRDEQVMEACSTLLQALQALLAERGDLSDEALVAELEELAWSRGLGVASAGAETTTDVVHVVEPDQALSFAADHVHVLGLSASQVPSPPPDECFLRDSDRQLLGLLDKDMRRQRELALLGACLLHATTSCVLSRPRRAASGRETETSLWHAQLAQSIGASLADEQAVPAHPHARAERRVLAGECPADLALTALALERADTEQIARLMPKGRAGIPAQARALESFAPSALARDAMSFRPGALDPARTISVSALEKLATCPLQFWFQSGLRLRPLPPPPELTSLPNDRVGSAVHVALAQTLQRHAKALRAAPDLLQLADAIVEQAQEAFVAEITAKCGEALRAVPELLHVLAERWQKAIATALRAELEHMQATGTRPAHFEHPLECKLSVKRKDAEATVELALSGRIDRVDALEGDQLGIVDYKTGSDPKQATSAIAILRGRKVQLVAYGMMLEAARGAKSSVTSLAIVGINPDLEPDAGRKEVAGVLDLLHGERAREVLHTLAVLQELRQAQLFPMQPHKGACARCEFTLACRRLHPPSTSRVDGARSAELARFLESVNQEAKKKSKQDARGDPDFDAEGEP